MIHGGVRTFLAQERSLVFASCLPKLLILGYLEAAVMNFDYRQLLLVFEALHERKTFIQNAPHLTRKLPIMTPCYSWWELPYYWVRQDAYYLLFFLATPIFRYRCLTCFSPFLLSLSFVSFRFFFFFFLGAQAGLKMYDLLSLGRTLASASWLSREQSLLQFPMLQEKGLKVCLPHRNSNPSPPPLIVVCLGICCLL